MMKTPMSIARRLALTIGTSAIILWLVAVGITGYVINNTLTRVFDQSMRESAIRLLPLAEHEIEDMLVEEFEADEVEFFVALTEQGDNWSYHFTDTEGRVLQFLSGVPPVHTDQKVEEGYIEFNGSPAFVAKDQSSGIAIIVVERPNLRAGFLRESLLAMLLPLAGLVPILMLVVYFVVRASMHPVLRLGQTISKRHGRNLAPLGVGPQPKELSPIADEVESLLQRLRSAMEAERNFAAESAHELRTPIAGALAQVQVLRKTLAGDEKETFAANAEDALRNLARLAENLLQMSRLEAGFALSSQDEALGEVFSLVLSEREFTLRKDRFDISGPLDAFHAHIVPDAFAIVVRNLLRNALLYAEKGSKISVTFTPNAMALSNDCPPLGPELLENMARRHVRGGATIRGSGLGLAITSSIVDDCGGTLIFTSPLPHQSRGFMVKVTFPTPT